jgi:hypothetical protein
MLCGGSNDKDIKNKQCCRLSEWRDFDWRVR